MEFAIDILERAPHRDRSRQPSQPSNPDIRWSNKQPIRLHARPPVRLPTYPIPPPSPSVALPIPRPAHHQVQHCRPCLARSRSARRFAACAFRRPSFPPASIPMPRTSPSAGLCCQVRSYALAQARLGQVRAVPNSGTRACPTPSVQGQRGNEH